jgi:ubiquinone/menaquinone biosynthesis C-methylase UbiE
MQEPEAIHLLKNDFIHTAKNTVWADLGCGQGTFTMALANLLVKESTIYAMDKNKRLLIHIPDQYKDCTIKKVVADFATVDLPFTNADGILMANSLHYVKDKNALIQKAIRHLNENGVFLIVEYDTFRSSPWVPYPLPFAELVKTFSANGFSFVEKLQERKSLYNNAMMYSALLKKEK